MKFACPDCAALTKDNKTLTSDNQHLFAECLRLRTELKLAQETLAGRELPAEVAGAVAEKKMAPGEANVAVVKALVSALQRRTVASSLVAFTRGEDGFLVPHGGTDVAALDATSRAKLVSGLIDGVNASAKQADEKKEKAKEN